MDSFEFNKIMGWILAAAIAVLGLSILTGYAFPDERPETMGFHIDVPEDPTAGAAAGPDPMVEFLTAMQAADVAKGEAVFRKCATCHTVEQGGANKQGPNLWGVLGRPVGTHAGFSYSSALADHGGTWTYELFNAYMASPRNTIPGNVMSFAGLSKAQDRANLVSYLTTQGGSSATMPEMPVAEVDEDPEGTGPEEAKAEDSPIPTIEEAEAAEVSDTEGPAAEQ